MALLQEYFVFFPDFSRPDVQEGLLIETQKALFTLPRSFRTDQAANNYDAREGS
jgi:hypothetical protein